MRIFYLILIIFFFLFCDNDTNATTLQQDYCNHPDCSLRNQHTMCIGAHKQSPRLYASGITPWMRYQILLLHNRHRDNIALGLEAAQPPATNMRKMYWDYELEQMAEIWARQCQKRHDECRNTIRFNVLQNMDVRPVHARVTEAQLLADAVGAWFSGSRVLPPEQVWSFKRNNCSAPGGCNTHWYSAAAWASTWRIGCSQALCTVKKNSCASFRKRRKLSQETQQLGEAQDNSTWSFSSTENILRRSQYMTSTLASKFEDFTSTDNMSTKESPLYRGIKDSETGQRKQREPNIIAYTICNYGPAGNIDGFPIYEAGNTCTNCPQGTQCIDRTHRALCAVLGDPDSRSN